MESKQTIFVLLIILLSINLISGGPNKLLANLLTNNLLDKKSIVQLLQLLFTAKLIKDYQVDDILPNDPQTNYMLFLGKGNIKFQNHELDDIENTTELLDHESTTVASASSDLAKNKHLLKFVARNGYDVWKGLQVVPYNSSAKGLDVSPTNDSFTESSHNITNDIIITTTEAIPEADIRQKSSKNKYDDQYVKSLKKLYKPDLQMIETEEGFIKHEVKPPKWVKNIIENGSEKGSRTSKSMKKMDKNKYIGNKKVIIKNFKKKANNNKSGSVKSDKTLPIKYINNKDINDVVISSPKKKTEHPTLKTINKKKNKVKRENQNNRIGNIVIKGFNGLIRGIGSILGIGSSEE